MTWLSKKQVFLNTFVTCVIWLTLYFLFRPFGKSLFNDVLDQNLHSYSRYEWIALLFLTIVIFILSIFFNTQSQRPKKYTLSVDETPDGGDRERISNFVKNTVKPDVKNGKKENYKDIGYKHPKTVYAITGNWRAGKTTSAIYFLKKISTLKISGQYYHDTFNFGNIDESIASFFSNISNMTGVKEFKQLGTASTPRFDIGFSLGPFSFKLPFSRNFNVNSLRSTAYSKLKDTFTIVIDDIDRLVPSEQLAWVRSIELLAKFEGKLIVVVPINYKEVEHGLASLDISPGYLEKIIPHRNRVAVGVDLDYIAKQFGGFETLHSDQDLQSTRKYTKFLFALSIVSSARAMISHNFSYSSWENQYINDEISATAHAFSSALSYSEPYQPQVTAAFGPNSEYFVSQNENILFNDGQQFPRHLVIKLATTYMTLHDRNLSGDFEKAPERILNTLNNVSQMQNIFGRVSFVQETRVNIVQRGGRGFPNDEGLNFWETIAPVAVKNIFTDPQLSSYFTYDIVNDYIERLHNASDEGEEAQVLIRFIKANLD
ncbi:MAG: family P-loop domain [Candidatus Saccharibacteria bacterium]|nr:family P-loop domain [Candidatus Saccharibacteria bacterium]